VGEVFREFFKIQLTPAVGIYYVQSTQKTAVLIVSQRRVEPASGLQAEWRQQEAL
jgi:hypothetical protein